MRFKSYSIIFSTFVSTFVSTICLAMFSQFCQAELKHDDLVANFSPGYRPDISTDEGGFWYTVDKYEKSLKRSPYLIRDPALNEYVGDIVCNLAGEHCADIRVYLVNNPHFNASMSPNGMMQVWSGLFLRVEDEAQLAAVLGHEIGHYLRSHQIQQWRKLRSEAAIALFFDIALTGGLATLAVYGNAMSFGRSHELEADLYGMQLMSISGYQPDAAVELWRYVDAEQNADRSTRGRSLFFETHPLPKKRIQKLGTEAARVKALVERDFRSGAAEYRSQVSRHYYSFMRNHLQLQEFEQSQLLLEHHRSIGYPAGQVAFFEGELYKLRKRDGDLPKAVEAYKNSLQHVDVPIQAYRELGYIYMKQKQYVAARSHFEEYLNRDLAATDKEMIRFYIDSIKDKKDEIKQEEHEKNEGV